MPMQVTLVRHTRVDVAPGTCYGWTDVPLAPTFDAEAAAVLSRLQPLMPFDAVFSSPLHRARRLAAYCGYESPQVDDRLKEMNMGEWEMQRYDDITDPYLQQWYADYRHLPTPGGEGLPQLYARVSEFLDWLRQQPYRHVAIFAHGGVLVCAGVYGGCFTFDEAYEGLLPPYGGLLHVTL